MIKTIEGATPEWLTDRLHESRALSSGRVLAVQISESATANSRAAHLSLTYSAGASVEAPRRIFLKLKGRHNGELEVAFYAMSPAWADHLPMIVRCLGAKYDPSSGASYCLLEDFSLTHGPPVSREEVLAGEGIPAPRSLDGIIDALAKFHAFWWETPRSGPRENRFEVRHWFRDEAHYRALVTRRENQYSRFLAVEKDWFPAELGRTYKRALRQLSPMWKRYLERRIFDRSNITLSHGDCYFSQFLVPFDARGGPTYMVDFDSVSANFGAYDLAYLFPTFWTSGQRREGNREGYLLKRYHAQLSNHGVRDYSWDDLLLDYRLMVVHMLFDPFIDHLPAAKSYWWPKMQCLADAYDDLDCGAL